MPGHRRRADERGDGRGEAGRAHPRGHAGQAHGHAQQEDDHPGRLQVGSGSYHPAILFLVPQR